MTASPTHPRHLPRQRATLRPSGNLPEVPSPGERDGPHIAPALRALAVPIGSIIVHPRNPRIGNVEAVKASLRRFGQQKPVVVQASTTFVVAGNHVVLAARALGWTAIAANVVELDDATALAFMLADNRTSDLGGYDDALLAAILAEQSAADNLAATGYDLADVAALLRAAGLDERDPDVVPDLPPPADVYVEPGQLWILGNQRLLCGDATNDADVARLLEGATPTLLATDPPYGVRLDQTWRDAAGYNALGRAEAPYMRIDQAQDAKSATPRAHGRGPGYRNTTLSGDTRADWSGAFALVRSLQVGYVWYASAHTLEVLGGLLAIGFELVQQIIWDKGLFAMSRQWYHWAHEPCFVVRKPGAKVPFYGERNQATIWRAPSPKMIMAGSTEAKQDHPAQKPVVLFETPIANHLRSGEAVYDPFAGSGTTLIAAERLGRRCYAMEIDPKYVQVAIERWRAFSGQSPQVA
ncbi:MAG: DNA methyltransferase [Candidatus Limnocylindrales bacterium]